MESDNCDDHGRPIVRSLRSEGSDGESQEYQVLDPELAQKKSIQYFTEALSLIDADPNNLEINENLILATDFGSRDACFVMALRILDSKIETPFAKEEVVVFLKIAADRGHPEAAVRLAKAYAGLPQIPEVAAVAKDYFTSFTPEERGQLGECYFMRAIQQEYQPAIEELILAYAYGRGHIRRNPQQFKVLCEMQVAKKNQSVTLGYGAWLGGMTVEGGDPLAEAIPLEIDKDRSLALLLAASEGENLELAQHGLHLICCGMTRGLWGTQDNLLRKLKYRAAHGNQLLSLYLAWYSIPSEHRIHMPQVVRNYELSKLGELVSEDEEQAIHYLDSAFFGADEDISAVAKEILSLVFGRCFMDSAGMLVWSNAEIS